MHRSLEDKDKYQAANHPTNRGESEDRKFGNNLELSSFFHKKASPRLHEIVL